MPTQPTITTDMYYYTCPCGKEYRKYGDKAGKEKWIKLHSKVCDLAKNSKGVTTNIEHFQAAGRSDHRRLVGATQISRNERGQITQLIPIGRQTAWLTN